MMMTVTIPKTPDHRLPILSTTNRLMYKNEDERGEAACIQSHSWLVAEQDLNHVHLVPPALLLIHSNTLLSCGPWACFTSQVKNQSSLMLPSLMSALGWMVPPSSRGTCPLNQQQARSTASQTGE